MRVELRYCTLWNYEPQAVSLTAQLLTAYKKAITEMVLIPSGGGCFELTVDGELIYSKLKAKKFPDEAAMVAALATKRGTSASG